VFTIRKALFLNDRVRFSDTAAIQAMKLPCMIKQENPVARCTEVVADARQSLSSPVLLCNLLKQRRPDVPASQICLMTSELMTSE
jgi:hypothetical protein